MPENSIKNRLFGLNCPDCGGAISDEAVYCPHCGVNLDEPISTDSNTQKTLVPAINVGQQHRMPKKTYSRIQIIQNLGIIVVIAGILLSISAVFHTPTLYWDQGGKVNWYVMSGLEWVNEKAQIKLDPLPSNSKPSPAELTNIALKTNPSFFNNIPENTMTYLSAHPDGWGFQSKLAAAGYRDIASALVGFEIIPSTRSTYGIIIAVLCIILGIILASIGKNKRNLAREGSTLKVFFCFAFEDVSRAKVVVNDWVAEGKEAAGLLDASGFDELENQGEDSIKNWYDNQIQDTSVTVVLVGQNTCSSPWVNYAITKSIENGNGLIGIDVSKIKDIHGKKTDRCGKIPEGYPFYLWFKDEGDKNLGKWIEEAARNAGR